MAITAREAIQESIDTDSTVTIDFCPDGLAYLKALVGFYEIGSHKSFEFRGGSESARNDWLVIMRAKTESK